MKHDDFRSRHEADAALAKPQAGQVWVYARLSDRGKGKESRDAGEDLTKSVSDQHKANRRTAHRYGLPLTEENFLSDNKSGGLWWGGVNLGIGDAGPGSDHRPEITRLRDAVLSGECKAIVTYSQCRLFRGSSMADAWMELCRANGVRIYDDASGLLDIWSSDGRAYVRFRANDDQRQREKSGNEAHRGIESCIDEGEHVVPAGRLGFRSMGRRSKKVRVHHEEVERVRWAFRAYTVGIDGSPPWGVNEIARHLQQDPTFQWLPDLVEKRGMRAESNKGRVYPQQIRSLLQDIRYIGKQRKNGREEPCHAFLLEGGETVIDPHTFELAKQRLELRHRVPGAKNRERHPFSGVLRCAHCGQEMAATVNWRATKHSPERTCYGRYTANGSYTCQHYLPPIEVGELDRYFRETLTPLVRAGLEARASAGSVAALLGERSKLVAEQREDERWLEEDLADAAVESSPRVAAAMERKREARIAAAKARIAEIDAQVGAEQALRGMLQRVDALTPEMASSVVRESILWAALVPNEAHSEGAKEGPRSQDLDFGRVLFCTVYGGVYHTAVVERVPHADRRRREFRLRPADESEVVGTLADLPSPAEFVAALMATADSSGRPWRAEEWAPDASPETLAEARKIAFRRAA